jgi:hypothetical protein
MFPWIEIRGAALFWVRREHVGSIFDISFFCRFLSGLFGG